jgi:hypothetical protein
VRRGRGSYPEGVGIQVVSGVTYIGGNVNGKAASVEHYMSPIILPSITLRYYCSCVLSM